MSQSPAAPKASGALRAVTLAGRAGLWDVTWQEGRITQIAQSHGPQAKGGYLSAPFVDIHTHLDKTMTVARMPRRASSLFDAIDMMAKDAANWTQTDVRARASLALEQAYHHGTSAMRSHIDWHQATPPGGFGALSELAADWRGKLHLELAALIPLDLVADVAPQAAQALAPVNGVLGAFLYRNDDMAAKLAQVFDLAERHDLALDFHVDEGLDPEACGFDLILRETEQRGLKGRVLCGHACSLSIRDPLEVADLLARAVAAGLGLTVQPGANAHLQDGQQGRTPRLRGLAPLLEADQAGMSIMLGSDNVRDAFYPYGDYDMSDVLRLATINGHLDPEMWIAAITERPSAWMGLDLALREGGAADFNWFAVQDAAELVSSPRAARTIWRAGQMLSASSEGDAK